MLSAEVQTQPSRHRRQRCDHLLASGSTHHVAESDAAAAGQLRVAARPGANLAGIPQGQFPKQVERRLLCGVEACEAAAMDVIIVISALCRVALRVIA